MAENGRITKNRKDLSFEKSCFCVLEGQKVSTSSTALMYCTLFFCHPGVPGFQTAFRNFDEIIIAHIHTIQQSGDVFNILLECFIRLHYSKDCRIFCKCYYLPWLLGDARRRSPTEQGRTGHANLAPKMPKTKTQKNEQKRTKKHQIAMRENKKKAQPN